MEEDENEEVETTGYETEECWIKEGEEVKEEIESKGEEFDRGIENEGDEYQKDDCPDEDKRELLDKKGKSLEEKWGEKEGEKEYSDDLK
jgi:hypothetical protein